MSLAFLVPLFTLAPERGLHADGLMEGSPRFRSLVADVAKGWVCADTFEKGAALAYYVVFSVGPIVLLLVWAAGMAFGESAAKGVLFDRLSGAFGPEVATAVDKLLAAAYRPRTGFLASGLSVVTLLFVATGAFTELKYSLNRIFDVNAAAGSSVQAFLKRRLAAFLAIVLLGVLLFLLIAVDTALSAASDYFGRQFSVSAWALRGISFGVSTCILTFLLFLLFKFLPDANPGWKESLAGAFVTAILFDAGKWLMSLYLGKTTTVSVYGAAGSIVIVLLAAYYFSQILFLGAVLCRELMRRNYAKQT